MGTAKWFDRQFAFDFGPEKYAGIYERLKEAPNALGRALTGLSEDVLIYKPDGGWSIKEHLGHLSVLEPIWRIRFYDIQARKPVLTPADLNNTATTEAGFNGWSVTNLLDKFAAERAATIAALDTMDATDESRTSLHPRMQQPMRLIDLAYFVAEHDDHHLGRIREIIRQKS